MSDGDDRAVEYEAADAEPKLIGWLAAATAVFLLLAPFVLRIAFPDALQRTVTGRFADAPEPRLQTDPASDLAALRQAEDQRLSNYGWLDAAHGQLHVPIDRAVELTLDRGLPGWQRAP